MTEKKDPRPIKEILESYVKHKNGSIFQVQPDVKNDANCYLRTKTTYKKMRILDIKQGLVDGTWFSINEHEWRKWVKEDNAYIESLSRKIIKRVILCQLVVELDDELIADHEGQNNMINHLKKSQKACERVAEKYFDKLFDTDQNVFQNMTKAIDEVTSKMSKMEVHDFLHLNAMVDDIINNPDKYADAPVEMELIQ